VIAPQVVPSELDELVMGCLAKDPNDRPQSVLKIQKRLESVSALAAWTQADAASWWEQNRPAQSVLDRDPLSA
jgi:hypothetical protein